MEYLKNIRREFIKWKIRKRIEETEREKLWRESLKRRKERKERIERLVEKELLRIEEEQKKR